MEQFFHKLQFVNFPVDDHAFFRIIKDCRIWAKLGTAKQELAPFSAEYVGLQFVDILAPAANPAYCCLALLLPYATPRQQRPY
jgi:hypothetical protein